MDSTQLPPNPSNQMVSVLANTNVERGELFRRLNENLSLNQYSLPEFVYQADLVPLNFAEYSMEQKANLLNAAAIPITFTHGYPAIFESQPFWEQLPTETSDAFNAFMIYIELPEKSAHENPVRMLPHIAELTKIPLEDIVAWSHMYYWHWRGRAYDLFLVACHRKQRELRLMSIEGHHFKMAEGFLNKMGQLIEMKFDKMMEPDSADFEEMKMKDMIDSMQKLVGIQRVSIGLSATGESRVDNGPRHAQASDVMQNIAKEASSIEESKQRSAEMDRILANPEDLEAVQNLITRLHSPTT